MEKELEKIIENKNMTSEKWKELVCDLIKLIPESKYNRVNYIINKDNLIEKMTLDEIIEAITKIEQDARNNKYCETCYYDYRLNEDIVEGDETWIDEIDKLLRAVKGLFENQEYEKVITAYEYIFDFIYEDGELYYLLPYYNYIDEKLESKIEEHYMDYLQAIFYSKDIDRAKKYAEVFEKYRFLEDVLHNFCVENNDFVSSMINLIVEILAQKENIYVNRIIFKLLIEENDIQSVKLFLKKKLKENFIVYKLMCDYLKNKHRYKEILINSFELEEIEMLPQQKEEMFNEIIEASGILKEDKVREKYLYKVNNINPKLKYTLMICKYIKQDQKIEQIEKLYKNIKDLEDRYIETVISTLLLGDIELCYEIYNKIGKYAKENVEDLIMYYILKFGYKEIKDKKLLTENLKDEIKTLNYSLDAEEIINIMNGSKKEMDKEIFEKVEMKYKKKIQKDTKTILSRQDRGMYESIANYLVTFAEHIYQEGRKEEAQQLLQEYQEEYKRYSAYRKCIQNEIKKSSIIYI